MRKNTVVITSGYRWTYFEWFILGFYKLKERGDINLKFKLSLGSQLLSVTNNSFIERFADKFRRCFEKDSYNMSGYVLFLDGKKKYFTIDCADAPYLFNYKELNRVNVYFKMQCPVTINEEGFKLAENVVIPWTDHEHVDIKYRRMTDRGERKSITISDKVSKIKPLMVGPRALSEKAFSYAKLSKGYNNYLGSRIEKKTKKIMCYFGNALGPVVHAIYDKPDFDWEADILSFYGAKLCHPNEKRAIVAKMIAEIDNSDARIISKSNSDSLKSINDAVVPLADFCRFTTMFEYNANVSGYRMSIPNRFIESFIVGTKIITDKLHVKWYKPFEEEVIETVEMGYLPMKQINWEKYNKQLSELPNVNPRQVYHLYDEKWEPTKVAEYIVNTVDMS